MFADYSNAFVSDKNLDKTMDTMNMELNKLVTCFIVNIIPESRKHTLYVIDKQQKPKHLQNSKKTIIFQYLK